MGRYRNTKLAHGTRNSPQLTFENTKHESKVNELEKIYNKKFIALNLDYANSKEKIINYLLNINNKKGKDKANFFNILGFDNKNPDKFFQVIKNAINKKIPFSIENTKYGEVLRFKEKIRGNKNKDYNVIIVIQKDYGKDYYRIITIYPGKKEK